jgi:hypothetical protein
MANTLKCRVHQILDVETTETSSGKSFSKQKIIFNASRFDQFTGEEYPNYPGIEFGGKAIDTIADLELSPGDMVEVSFSLEGRFYKSKDTGEEKHLTSIRGFKIERLEQRQSSRSPFAPSPTPDPFAPAPAQASSPSTAGQEDDEVDSLPF